MSEKTVASKLRIAPGAAVWVSNPACAPLLGPLPDGASRVDRPEDARIALVIADDAVGVRAALAQHVGALGRSDAFWVLYPKGNRTDFNRDTLWPILAEHGFRPITQVAVDEVWSALRFRLRRDGEPGFGG